MGRSVSQPVPSPFNKDLSSAPAFVVPISVLYAKTAPTSVSSSELLQFFNSVNASGSSVDMVTPDTYEDVCDISGGGFFAIAGSACDGLSTPYVSTLEITLDGVVREVTFTSNIVDRRLMIGFSSDRVDEATTATYMPTNSTTDGYTIFPRLTINHPLFEMNRGAPLLRFESALKVRAKCSVVSSDTYDKKAFATYFLDK